MAERGELFIISAPSGAGKTTLIQNLLLARDLVDPGTLAFSVSHTTRRPRDDEKEGKAYHFVDLSAFERMVAAGEFLEWATVHDNCYGTSHTEVMPRLEQGVDVILDIDVQGAEQVQERCPEAHSIFVMPPSYDALESRLHGRGKDEGAAIARRLAVSLSEIERYHRYHYVIINDDARHAGEILAAIILEKRHRRERMQGRIQEILGSFQARYPKPNP